MLGQLVPQQSAQREREQQAEVPQPQALPPRPEASPGCAAAPQLELPAASPLQYPEAEPQRPLDVLELLYPREAVPLRALRADARQLLGELR